MSDAPDRSPSPPSSSRASIDPRDVALRVFAVVGLAFSAMLLVDYLYTPVFCAGHASGCDAVRHSHYSRIVGVPLPVLGAIFFGALLVAAAVATRGARTLLALLGGGGVAAGVGLVVLQAVVLHHFCKLCLVVDASSLGAGACAMLLSRDGLTGLSTRLRGPTIAAALAALVLPIGYGVSQPPPQRRPDAPLIEPMPEVIAHEQSPGVATVVEFVDFECPFCRRQQEALAPVLASYGSRVRLVRRNVPLPFHEHAQGAARAQCCAEEQGRGERMAEVLFTSDDITLEGCEHIAQRLGLDMAAYRSCLASRRPDVLLERDSNDARGARVGGLPTLWIGTEKFEGLTSAEALRASIDRALRASTTGDASTTSRARSGT